MTRFWQNLNPNIMLWGGLTVLAFAIFTLIGDHGLLRYRELDQIESELKYKITSLQLETNDLKKQIIRLKDPSEVERVAREELGFLRNDEVLYIIDEKAD